MATKRDYYQVLEVPNDASEEDIRKAFRRKALEYHPDRNKAEDAADRFKEVNEAYQVLTDPQRRQRYDRFGHAAGGPGAGAQAGGGFEGFGDVFGGFGDIFDAFFGGGGVGGGRPQARPGPDLSAKLTVSFEEAAFGTPKNVDVNRTERCGRCEGSASEPGHSPTTCENCKGSGRVRRSQRSIFGQFVTEAACNVCSGTGRTVTHPCTQCKGSGRERAKRTLEVAVPAGVFNGARLNLRGQGDAGEAGAPAGDLLVDIRVEPHPLFDREENDLLYTLNLTYPQAALGTEVQVPSLDGETKLKVPAGTAAGTVFALKGKGIPHLGRPDRRGDELVTVNVVIPEKLSKRQKQLLEELQRELEH